MGGRNHQKYNGCEMNGCETTQFGDMIGLDQKRSVFM